MIPQDISLFLEERRLSRNNREGIEMSSILHIPKNFIFNKYDPFFFSLNVTPLVAEVAYYEYTGLSDLCNDL